MVKVEALALDVIAEATGVPVPYAERELLASAREFCRRSRYWKENLYPTALKADTAEYQLMANTPNTTVFDVDIVKVDDTVLVKSTEHRHFGDTSGSGAPTEFSLGVRGAITLYPTPSVGGGVLNIRAIIVPTTRSTSLDDRLVDDYGDALVHGALYRLARQPNREWSDKATAAHYIALFEESVSEALQMAEDGYTKGIARTVRYGGY